MEDSLYRYAGIYREDITDDNDAIYCMNPILIRIYSKELNSRLRMMALIHLMPFPSELLAETVQIKELCLVVISTR